MKKFRNVIAALVLASFAPLMPLTASAAPIEVDLQLVLAVDVSGSVNATEFALQRDGYVQAFESAAIQNAITSGGTFGRIAVTYVYWANSAVQSISWTLIDSAESANNFATAIAAVPRPLVGAQTGIGNAINFSSTLFGQTGGDGELLFTSGRQIIDISGDGSNNTGAAPAGARDAFLAGPSGVSRAINAVAIESFSLVAYFTNNVIGGDGSFVLFASSFADFDRAIQAKLLAEIKPPSGVPEPTTLALLGIGLLGMAAGRRRLAA